MNFKKENGVTIVALAITIIVLLIISAIAIRAGVKSAGTVKLEELKTNMLLIQAKAKEYVEEANFKIGKETNLDSINNIKEDIYVTNGKLEKVDNNSNIEIPSYMKQGNVEYYEVTEEALNLWGLNKIKKKENEYYLVSFDENEMSVEVYNTKGYNGKYSLSDI